MTTPMAPMAPQIQQRFNPNSIKAGLARSVRSEMKKITSLRSMKLLLAGTIVGWIVIMALIASAIDLKEGDKLTPYDLVGGWPIPLIPFIVIGALAVTSEYANNTMRTTVLSDPKRSRSYVAKLVAVLIYTGIGALVMTVASVVITDLISPATFTYDDEFWKQMSYFVIVLVGTAAWALGAGYWLRSTAGAISIVFMLIFVIQMIQLLPWNFFQETLPDYLPWNIINGLFPNTWRGEAASDFSNLFLFLAYPIVFNVIGFFQFIRKDI